MLFSLTNFVSFSQQKILFLNFFCFSIVHSTNFANFLETFARFFISENWGKNPLVIMMCAQNPLLLDKSWLYWSHKYDVMDKLGTLNSKHEACNGKRDPIFGYLLNFNKHEYPLVLDVWHLIHDTTSLPKFSSLHPCGYDFWIRGSPRELAFPYT